MAPRIGIPMCLDDRQRWRRGRSYLYIDRAYADAVSEVGGVPVHIPPQTEVAGIVDALDALLLPGGDDFAPSRPYPPEVEFDVAPAEQVAFDRRLLAEATRRRLPVLGICYGMQLLVLERGGALHYHLPLDCPTAHTHALVEESDRHEVAIEADSRLSTAIGATTAQVNSLHHQAVSDPGPGLRVVARAADGVIEAVEAPGEPFYLGVQWHPEKLDTAGRTPLFRALVTAANTV